MTPITRYSKSSDAVDAFLEEIISIYKKHGFSLGHEDSHGAFIVEEYSKENIQWLLNAMYFGEIDAKR